MDLAAFIENNRSRAALPEHEIKAFLRAQGFGVPKGISIGLEEPLPAELGLSYPLVAKVVSPALPSKTEVQGVRLDLSNREELERAVTALKGIDRAEGVLVEEKAGRGVEVIIGGIVDAQFGPVVMFGLGGIFVELYKDVAFGLAPLTVEDALRLAGRIKGSRLLQGYRGAPPVDREALAQLLATVSEIIATGAVQEITLNPVALYPQGAMVLDAKLLFKPA